MQMQIIDVDYDTITEISYHKGDCECGGKNEECFRCNGTGLVYLPFICLMPNCAEGFQKLEELNTHYQEAHGVCHVHFA